MRGKHSLFYHILIFVIAQLVWLLLLGIWIYWYVSNYIVFEKVGEEVSPQLIYDVQNALPFILGLILLIGLSFTTSLIFRHLNVQLRITELYDNFIGNVTHELKSPLSSIQLYLETLKQREVPVEKRKEFIDMMMKDADRLQSLINSILEISAQEKKKLLQDYRVHKAEIIVKELIEESCEKFRVEKENYRIISNAACEIVASKDALKVVFDNLVDNAVKYSTIQAKIVVSLICNSKKVEIIFSDLGIGVAAKEQKKIFNKFYRIYNKEIPNVKGTGLGLYRVKEIIKAHNGKITVLSEGEGKGTTFKLELPAYSAMSKRQLKKFLQTEKLRGA
ncbi:MAG TPA: HAMP domain-containing sensor histidine kinase [Ignavibacteriaceae bacterium]|nr:HAMP domain-containing sensor histidine kinase [Ignavibacteriaceae bacterium]